MSKEKKFKKGCMTEGCSKPCNCRGVCHSCYQKALRSVKDKFTTWDALEEAGLVMPSLRPAARLNKFAEAIQKAKVIQSVPEKFEDAPEKSGGKGIDKPREPDRTGGGGPIDWVASKELHDECDVVRGPSVRLPVPLGRESVHESVEWEGKPQDPGEPDLTGGGGPIPGLPQRPLREPLIPLGPEAGDPLPGTEAYDKISDDMDASENGMSPGPDPATAMKPSAEERIIQGLEEFADSLDSKTDEEVDAAFPNRVPQYPCEKRDLEKETDVMAEKLNIKDLKETVTFKGERIHFNPNLDSTVLDDPDEGLITFTEEQRQASQLEGNKRIARDFKNSYSEEVGLRVVQELDAAQEADKGPTGIPHKDLDPALMCSPEEIVSDPTGDLGTQPRTEPEPMDSQAQKYREIRDTNLWPGDNSGLIRTGPEMMDHVEKPRVWPRQHGSFASGKVPSPTHRDHPALASGIQSIVEKATRTHPDQPEPAKTYATNDPRSFRQRNPVDPEAALAAGSFDAAPSQSQDDTDLGSVPLNEHPGIQPDSSSQPPQTMGNDSVSYKVGETPLTPQQHAAILAEDEKWRMGVDVPDEPDIPAAQ